jgi:hypothetical protein
MNCTRETSAYEKSQQRTKNISKKETYWDMDGVSSVAFLFTFD